MKKRELHALGKICSEAVDYATEVSPAALTSLDVDRFVYGLLATI
jgi:hypothetical protein